MVYDYAKAAETANRMIDKFGQTAVLRRQGTPYGPPHAPRVSLSYHQIKCVRLDLKVNPFKQIDPTASWSVKAGQERLLLRVQEGVVPAIGDQIMMDGVTAFLTKQDELNFKRQLTVEFVSALKPAGINVLFDLVVHS